MKISELIFMVWGVLITVLVCVALYDTFHALNKLEAERAASPSTQRVQP